MQLMNARWRDAYEAVLDDLQESLDPRLAASIERAAQEILSDAVVTETLSDGDVVHAERRRAADIMTRTFFEAYDEVCVDGEIDESDERLPEAINAAERDILGEYTPEDLQNDPGALMAAVRELGITTESRSVAGHFESRWVCATCARHGEWTPSRTFLQKRLDHEHAASHTVGIGS